MSAFYYAFTEYCMQKTYSKFRDTDNGVHERYNEAVRASNPNQQNDFI